ncbi:MAG: zinc-ribbon domain-containing protein [Synergistaceae bacterium]
MCNLITEKYPHLVSEWDESNSKSIDRYTHGSKYKALWICQKCGEKWEARIYSRTTGGAGCPYCSGHRVSDRNRLFINYPELMDEWDFSKNKIDPNTVSVCSSKRVWWKCEHGHQWKTCVYSRAKEGTNCPYCSNQKICETNCIAATNPELIKLWHPSKNNNLTPYNICIGSERIIWWRCHNGHDYIAKPSYKKAGKGECPYCNGTKVCEQTCLKIVNSNIAQEWHPTKNGELTPNDVFPWTNKMVWWECSRGHEWQSTVNNRSSGNSCPYCSKIHLIDGTIWDSYTEAYVYLKYRKLGYSIIPHKKYGMGKSKCDFFIKEMNLYCEVTSFSEFDCPPHGYFFEKYIDKIHKKEKYVTTVLGAHFRFISIRKLNKNQKAQVLREIVK